jgi:hypothetical protein
MSTGVTGVMVSNKYSETFFFMEDFKTIPIGTVVREKVLS